MLFRSLGLAVSGYIQPLFVAFGFAAYLMMSVQSLLRAHISGVFHLATGGIGLTEVRCIFLLANTLFYFVPPMPLNIFASLFSYSDLFGMAWIAVNVVMYVTTMVAELKTLRSDRSKVSKKHERASLNTDSAQ